MPKVLKLTTIDGSPIDDLSRDELIEALEGTVQTLETINKMMEDEAVRLHDEMNYTRSLIRGNLISSILLFLSGVAVGLFIRSWW